MSERSDRLEREQEKRAADRKAKFRAMTFREAYDNVDMDEWTDRNTSVNFYPLAIRDDAGGVIQTFDYNLGIAAKYINDGGKLNHYDIQVLTVLKEEDEKLKFIKSDIESQLKGVSKCYK